MKKTFFAIALLGLLGTACTKQSELNLEDIEMKATLQGKVFYERGILVEKQSTQLTAYLEPADGVTVLVSVPYSQYKSGAVGNKYYEVKTDANGDYSVSLPVGNGSISAQVSVIPFTRKYTTEVNGVLTDFDNALYNNVTARSVTLSAYGMVQAPDLNVSATVSTDRNLRTKDISLTGEVKAIAEEYVTDVNDRITGTTVAEKAMKSESSVLLVFSARNDNRTIVYPVTTASTGKYTLDAKVYDSWEYADMTVRVKVEPYKVTGQEGFSHYYQSVEGKGNDAWATQRIDGVYEGSASTSVTSSQEFFSLKMNDLVLYFTPGDYSTIKGIGNPDVDYDEDNNRLYYTNNPMGWSY